MKRVKIEIGVNITDKEYDSVIEELGGFDKIKEMFNEVILERADKEKFDRKEKFEILVDDTE